LLEVITAVRYGIVDCGRHVLCNARNSEGAFLCTNQHAWNGEKIFSLSPVLQPLR